MHAGLLLVASLIALSSLGSSVTYAQLPDRLVINEVEMDPLGTDYGKQWVELYNPTNSDLDISGWRLKAASGALVTIRLNTSIMTEAYLVIPLPRITLIRTGDSLTLGNAKNTPIDATPRLSDLSDNNLTWQRFPNGLDTGSAADWRLAPATKGESNGKLGAELTLTSSTKSVVYGDSIILSGRVNLTMRMDITLHIRSASSTAGTTITTLGDGTFTYVWQPDLAGTYTITASWNGDQLHNPAASSAIAVFVDKRATKLSMYPTTSNLTDISPVTFTGTIEPAIPGAAVRIVVEAPNGTEQYQTLKTFGNGSFRYVFLPSGSGNWTLVATWLGDENHYGDASAKSTLTVTPSIRSYSVPLLIFELITVPVTLAIGVYVYKYGRVPLRAPLGQILKRRAPPHLRPLRVLNGAICPLCFRPMMYEPKGADWHCEHCGVYYET